MHDLQLFAEQHIERLRVIERNTESPSAAQRLYEWGRVRLDKHIQLGEEHPSIADAYASFAREHRSLVAAMTQYERQLSRCRVEARHGQSTTIRSTEWPGDTHGGNSEPGFNPRFQ